MKPLRFICAPSFSVMPALNGGDALAARSWLLADTQQGSQLHY